MVSTYTPNLNLNLQGTGDNSGTWGSVLNTDVFTIIDNALGNVQTLSLSSTDVTLTTTQTQNNAFILTGTLTANVAVIWPAIGRMAFVINNTTGSFTVTLKAGVGSTTVTIAQGISGVYVINGNAVYAQVAATIIPAGTKMLFAQASAPTGWTKDTDVDDTALRLVSGTGGGTGGSVAFSTLFARTSVDATTLSIGQVPAHTHTLEAGYFLASGSGANVFSISDHGTTFVGNVTSGPTSSSGGGGSHTHNIDMQLKYLNIIKGTKAA